MSFILEYQSFFANVARARLTGEQSRVLFSLMSKEHQGELWLDRAEAIKSLGVSESNFSRSLKALKDKGIIVLAEAGGYDGRPALRINKQFSADLPHVGAILEADAAESERLLYDATSVFLKELYLVHASHLVYRVVGLNAKKYRGAGAEFINFSQMLAQRSIVIGLESLFEKLDDGAGLCSVRGLLRLAKPLKVRNLDAVKTFVSKYGGISSGDWYEDVQNILNSQRASIGEVIKLTSALRNNRIAHLTHEITPRQYTLPSIAQTEKAIEFAHDFYSFITVAFLQSATGAELRPSIGLSLVSLLQERFGVMEAKFDFDESK